MGNQIQDNPERQNPHIAQPTPAQHPEKKRSYGVWIFIGLVIVCSIVTGVVMNIANTRLEDTHSKIISHQMASSQKVDSLLQAYRKLKVDSLSSSETSVEKLNAYLLKIAEDATNNDSNERIANLLESELSKIQNEYEVLNLWCALLTVVFLIFSFFSIFKANEMANQGEDVLRDMRNTEDRVAKKSDELEKEIKRINTMISEVSSSVTKLKGNHDALSSKIEAMKTTDIPTLEKQVKDLSSSMTALSENFGQISSKYKDAEKEFNQFVEMKTQEFSLSVDAKFKDIEVQIKQIAGAKIAESYKENSESVKKMQREVRILFEEITEIVNEYHQQRSESEMDVTPEMDSDDETGLLDSDEEETSTGISDKSDSEDSDE